MNDLDELNFTPLPPVTDQDLAMVRGVVNSNRLHMIKGLASVPLSEEFDFCFASMFVRQVRQCFSVVWADGFPRCRHRFPVM